jgi:transcriptional regulator with XRE-family HTH domain
MSKYQYLAVNLRAFRAAYLLSQAGLAARAGGPFSQTYISQLECGRWPHRPEHVSTLARVLGVSESALLRKRNAKRPQPCPPVRAPRHAGVSAGATA